MAYTGILVRADTFNTIYLDPPVAREIAIGGEHLGLGTHTSQVHWLNIAALAKISEIVDANGTFSSGFKTSDLPITYDAGLIEEDIDWLLIDSTYKFRFNSLNALEVLSDTSFKFGSKDIDVEVFDFITTGKPEITALSTTDATATFTQGEKVLIYNETTKALLGEITTSGSVLNFASQTIGDDITAQAVDASYNHSAKAVQTII